MDFKAILKEERERARRERTKSAQLDKGSTLEKAVSRLASNLGAAVPETEPVPIQFPSFKLSPNRPKVSLDEHRLPGLPTIYYIPDWITEEEELSMLDQTYAVPADHTRWVNLKKRRLQNWGGMPHPDGMVSEALPVWLQAVGEQLVGTGVVDERVAPNHVLLNEYNPGQGIMPHRDGPLYEPYVITLSLGSASIMTFEPYTPTDRIGENDPDTPPPPSYSLVLQRRSLVVFTADAYLKYMHSITFGTREFVRANVMNAAAARVSVGDEVVREEAHARVSLTFRRVLRAVRPGVAQNLLAKLAGRGSGAAAASPGAAAGDGDDDGGGLATGADAGPGGADDDDDPAAVAAAAVTPDSTTDAGPATAADVDDPAATAADVTGPTAASDRTE